MNDMTSATPRPGSQAAINDGCTCPVIDNHYGRGVQTKNGVEFWISGDCPVHAKPRSNANDK